MRLCAKISIISIAVLTFTACTFAQLALPQAGSPSDVPTRIHEGAAQATTLAISIPACTPASVNKCLKAAPTLHPMLPNPVVRKPKITPPPDIEVPDRFHWKPAIAQSLAFLAMQHAFRMTEEKTRRGLEGKFFPDWQESVGNLRGWNDGGRFFTNYIAHPLQGSTTSRIFINNSDSANRQVFGRSKTYWTSRLKSMAWSAIWSLQFEIGPISEASLGNVGKEFQKNGKSKLTYLDIVITPTLGTALTIGEDAIDRYVLARWFERKFRNRLAMKITRSVFTPTTSVANILRMHAPWWRDFRPN